MPDGAGQADHGHAAGQAFFIPVGPAPIIGDVRP